MVQLEHVTKTYPTARGPVDALRDVDLTVEPGEFVAVRGHSGSGKSTLLTLVGGLGTPTSGRVIVADRNLAELSSGERAHLRGERIGFVFQMFHLFPYLSVLDNVLVAAATPNDETRRRAEDLVERFGIGHRLTHRPAELSTGERQRVAMARALLNRPALLLADEPTGNLDPDNAAVVMQMLTDFQHDGGCVMLVTHDAESTVAASRLLRLEAGQLVEDTVLA
ncbi:MAG: ABC transporter ATP-binding protein [Planctomycetales bacterium]|nr:ABC transporter ATP-binding protein [Planctomycetales bacterium]